jgi:hypothetical protein
MFLIVVVGSFIAATMAAAWGLFQEASRPYPINKFHGTIKVEIIRTILPQDQPIEGVDLLFTAQNKHDRDIDLDVILHIKSPRDSCLPYDIYFSGDASLTRVQEFGLGTISSDSIKARAPITHLRRSACPIGGVSSVELRDGFSGSLQGSMTTSRGIATSVHAPTLDVTWEDGDSTALIHTVEDPSKGLSTKTVLHLETKRDWDLGDLAEHHRIETSSGELQGPGLRWTLTDEDFVFAPTATLVDINRERSASQALFWAGVLAGTSASGLLWLVELITAKRRQANGPGH